MRERILIGLFLLSAAAGVAEADQQQIPPGSGLQSAVVIDTGADGLCNSLAAPGDIQAAEFGRPEPNLAEIRCGADKTVSSSAVGDDVQLVAVGATCKTVNTAIIDTGENGIPDTPLAGDDAYAPGMAFSVPPANRACVIAGADGVAQTAAAFADDTLLLAAGTAQANTAVALCGPNLVADTTANNLMAGDDVQVVPVGNACAAGDVVVNSGADGIATTRSEGSDLRLRVVNRVRVNIPSGQPSASRTVHLKISNDEFGSGAPAARTFRLATSGITCPGGIVSQIDADATTPGLQATADVGVNDTVTASLVVTVRLQNVTSATSRAPTRCRFDVSAVAIDTDPDVDDAANPEGNVTTIEVEGVDHNDL